MPVQLHILTAGAQIVQNHNQRSCVSVVYVACDESVQDGAQRHILLVQQLHPSHVDRLPGQQRLDAKRMQQVKLKLTHVIPMLLSLDSKLCALLMHAFSPVSKQPVQCIHVNASLPALERQWNRIHDRTCVLCFGWSASISQSCDQMWSPVGHKQTPTFEASNR